ncbi:endothelin-converting enzyme homolog isoform X2 [Oppia nitens]|nr:endothelin-converting enzyme homolog isoform X2 [Oppia nitens]XP_054159303.1 endothelin-converting enzyme homolog isoform X2 [Oppia nitens]
MPRYTKTDFDDEDVSEVSTFPTDITITGIGNPNLSVSGQQLANEATIQENIHQKSSTTPPGVSFWSPVTGSAKSRVRRRSFWDRSSPFEKLLLIVIAFLSCVIIILISVLTAQSNTTLHVNVSTQNKSQYCLTPSCITVASAIINAIDYNVDPCQDFYQYACGGWIRDNPLPDGKSIWGTFGKLWQENQLVMKNVLEEPKDDYLLNKAERKARIYYDSCVDKNETIERLGHKPLQEFLDDINGWNISGKFDVNKWDFQQTIQLLHNKYNRGGLFTWAVGADERNSSHNIIQIDQNGLGLPSRDYYLNKSANNEVLKAYLTFMTKVGVLLGGEENTTTNQMIQVLDFETKLAQITIPADQRRDDERTYHKMTLKDLNRKSRAVNWVQYFRFAFNQINKTITENEPIVVYSPDYMINLTLLIDEYLMDNQKKIVLANYLSWSAVQTLTSCLSKPFREASKILRKALMGSEGSESPWRYCVTDTNGVMGFALGAMFVKAVFHGESKQMAQTMIEEVRDAFKNNLPHLKWMDEETRDLAKDKADAITDMIGFPDFILNDKKLDEKYDGLNFQEKQYFKNNIEINKFAFIRNLQKIDKSANKSEWEMSPPTVNAYYTPTKNQIVFPAGILQAPFYDVNYPKSLNFGAMGVVMGHELSHAFDDQGREYDKSGNLHQWWKNSTIKKFEEKMKCFSEQYSKYKVGNETVNGKQTIGENVADNGGLTAAYNAYKSWISKHPLELPLPGVNLTNLQLFFVGFSQVWCSTSTPEALRLQIMNDPHSPAQFRVIGTLSNSPEFAHQFKCPFNSPMNPNNKCIVW